MKEAYQVLPARQLMVSPLLLLFARLDQKGFVAGAQKGLMKQGYRWRWQWPHILNYPTVPR
jgi:hypothetical protein